MCATKDSQGAYKCLGCKSPFKLDDPTIDDTPDAIQKDFQNERSAVKRNCKDEFFAFVQRADLGSCDRGLAAKLLEAQNEELDPNYANSEEQEEAGVDCGGLREKYCRHPKVATCAECAACKEKFRESMPVFGPQEDSDPENKKGVIIALYNEHSVDLPHEIVDKKSFTGERRCCGRNFDPSVLGIFYLFASLICVCPIFFCGVDACTSMSKLTKIYEAFSHDNLTPYTQDILNDYKADAAEKDLQEQALNADEGCYGCIRRKKSRTVLLISILCGLLIIFATIIMGYWVGKNAPKKKEQEYHVLDLTTSSEDFGSDSLQNSAISNSALDSSTIGMRDSHGLLIVGETGDGGVKFGERVFEKNSKKYDDKHLNHGFTASEEYGYGNSTENSNSNSGQVNGGVDSDPLNSSQAEQRLINRANSLDSAGIANEGGNSARLMRV